MSGAGLGCEQVSFAVDFMMAHAQPAPAMGGAPADYRMLQSVSVTGARGPPRPLLPVAIHVHRVFLFPNGFNHGFPKASKGLCFEELYGALC